MKELATILSQAEKLNRRGKSFALATVVRIDGSAFRRPGARMLITAEGEPIGTISGGCLEGEVVHQARKVLETGRPVLQVFEIDEDDPFLGFGSGCGGTVYVLIERIGVADSSNPLTLIRTCLANRTPALLATVYDGTLPDVRGRHVLLTEDHSPNGQAGHPALTQAMQADAATLLKHRRPEIRRYTFDEGNAEVLFELIQPPIQLFVLGNGPDVGPLVQIAHNIGFHVTVIGRKPMHDLERWFPQADRHVFVMHPEQVLDHLSIDNRSAAVIMNHNFIRDQHLLGLLLGTPMPYIGCLGPGRRTKRMLDEIKSPNFPEEVLERMYAPVGLNLGSETPEEIALSILAEIQAVLTGHSADMLRNQQGPIHKAVPVVN